MEQQATNQDVGSSVPVVAIVASLVAVLVVVAGVFLYRAVSAEVAYRQLIIASGSESGTYHALGRALGRVLEETGSFASVVVQTTDGSVENMELIRRENTGIDLAFVQGDASPSANARLITELYEEFLHILVSRVGTDHIKTIYDLQGKRVALGSAGSGTRELSQRVLKHFGVVIAEDLLLSPREAAARLADGTIDAAFMLSAIPSRLVSELAGRDEIRFLSLGHADQGSNEANALELVLPGVRSATIPPSTYVRLPRAPVNTVSVAALLVARKDLDEALVRLVTATIFENRSGVAGLEGGELMVARRIREHYDPASVIIPYHPGATAYYRREEPPFFVQYAEALSLGLTLMLVIYSVFIAGREWLRRRMKNRVDAYLLEVERLAARLHTLSHDELLAQQQAMETLRRAAFADLVAERLLADEAFTILQSHLRDELGAIENRLAELAASQ
jgi:TRAP transporter TAXI family solute receptor